MKPCQNTKAAFTLIELLASMAILGVMTVLLFSAFDQTSKAWLQGESRVETYSSARAALDYMSRELAQAMVNSNNLQFFGTTNAMAFIAPSDDRAGDPVDMAEVVYRLNQIPASTLITNAPPLYLSDPFTNNAPPYTLIRRSSVYSNSTTAADCWDYGNNRSCASYLGGAWDFYNPNPVNPNWMETSNSNRTSALAENIMSLTFQYVSTNGIPYPFWNSTNSVTGPVPVVWKNELPNDGIPWNSFDVYGNPKPNGGCILYMSNRPPAGVYITIGAIDSRTAARLQAIAPGGVTNAANVGAYTNTLNQAERFFTTFVEIPNQ